MQIIDREQTSELLRVQWELLQQTPSNEIQFSVGSERFGLRREVTYEAMDEEDGEEFDDSLTMVTSKIAIYQPKAKLGIYSPKGSNIQLLEDELSARAMLLNFSFDEISTEAQQRLNLDESPFMITSESLTRPEFEGRGLGSHLFDFSQDEVSHLVTQYSHLLQGWQLISQVVDGARNQTTGKEKSGWTSRRALAHGYILRPEYPKRPVWHKDVTP
jgi:hypothetical protein